MISQGQDHFARHPEPMIHVVLTEEPEDFHGHQFRVVTRRYFPTIDFEREGEGKNLRVRPLDSVNTRMIEVMARHLNFT